MTGAGWVRSTFCDTGGCIEAKRFGDLIGIRTTNTGSIVMLTRVEFAAFVAGVKNGDFDQLVAGDE